MNVPPDPSSDADVVHGMDVTPWVILLVIVPMDRYENHTRIIFKEFVRAVSVMHIPIKDQYPRNLVNPLRVPRSDCDVVIKAVTSIALVDTRVVTWWPDTCKGVIPLGWPWS